MTAATSDRPRTRSLSPPLILAVYDASLSFGSRTLWSHLNLRVRPGEFVAVLGPNGAGKTSLFRAVLGAQPLTAGSIELLGAPVRRGHRLVGYVPQQRLTAALRYGRAILSALASTVTGSGSPSPAARDGRRSIR